MKALLALLVLTLSWSGFRDQSTQNPNDLLDQSLNEIRENQRDHAENTDALWAYLKFADVPDQRTRERMSEYGVELFQYQPDLKWFSILPVNITSEQLAELGVQRVNEKPLNQTIDVRYLNDELPSYAYVGTNVGGVMTVAATGAYQSMIAELNELGIEAEVQFEPLGLIAINGSREDIIRAASLPYVIYIELPQAPEELELEDEMSMTRGAYINGYYSLDGVNGDGVIVAVNEAGRVDTAYELEYRNRLDRSLESGSASGHKTRVSLRMMGAGNIDPALRGQAWGADVRSGGISFPWAAQTNVNIVNTSTGQGCISGNATYNSQSATHDYLVYTYENFMLTYSCGNIGASTCDAYGAGPGWGNITGLHKSAKNIFAVGAMTTGNQLTNFSSRGPAMDGRILPDITATGPGGTSHASPNLAGVYAILVEGYRNQNNGAWPNSGLIKGIILNTADDIENPGPDFKSGFGRINGRRALEVIDNAQFLTDSVANNATKTHTITVPSGVSEVKVSLYWTDKESTAGITGKTLINNLDLRLQQPNNTWLQPWVLNTYPHADSLNLDAVRGTDTLNNVEMVTLANPAAGTYTVEVDGDLVPFGPQKYQVIYSFVYDSLTVIYPRGNESLVPGEDRHIRWDVSKLHSNPIDVEYTLDNGASWQTLATGLPSSATNFNWTIPNVQSGECRVRITSGGQSVESDQNFTISEVAQNLELVWRCADSAMVSWDSIPNAVGYWVYRLGVQYMDTVGYATNTLHRLYNLSSTESDWVSVQAVLPDSGRSRRAYGFEIPVGNFNCVSPDLSTNEIVSPVSGVIPSCLSSNPLDLIIEVQNSGVSGVPYVPIAYRLNSGAVVRDTVFGTLSSAVKRVVTYTAALQLQTGSNTLRVWTTYPGDQVSSNDTVEVQLTTYASSAITLPYTQNFDNFSTCSTAWGCGGITCALSAGWYNVPNGVFAGDSIDWRTHTGGTGTGGTGPSSDHTSGTGNYLYLEGSGNSGSGCRHSSALLQSPCIDLSGANEPTLSFWYHGFGNDVGSMHVDVYVDGRWYEDVVAPTNGDQGDQWIQKIVNLQAFVGKEVMLRFRGITGNGWRTDMAIDDIEIYSLPLAQFDVAFDTICLGQSVSLQNTSTYSNTYSWSITGGNFTYSSGNASSANPVILPSDTGWYSGQLITTNAFGADTLTIAQLFYVNSFANPSITEKSGGSPYCDNDTVVFEAMGSALNYTFYQNGTVAQSGSSNIFKTTALNDGDSVWVAHVLNNTCQPRSSSITVQILPNPSKPSITHLGSDVLQATVQSNSYNWWKDGQPLADQTQSITASGSGFYRVQAVDMNCPSDTSDPYFHSMVGIEELNDLGIRIYPNPASDVLYIQLDASAEFDLHLIDLNGRVLMTSRLVHGETELSLSGLPAGVYVVRGIGEGAVFNYTLVVQP